MTSRGEQDPLGEEPDLVELGRVLGRCAQPPQHRAEHGLDFRERGAEPETLLFDLAVAGPGPEEADRMVLASLAKLLPRRR